MRDKHTRHPIRSMAIANLDSWVHSPRTAVLLIFTVMLCYLEVGSVTKGYSQLGFTINIAEAPYIFLAYGLNIVMSSILFFVMISELPRQLPYQSYMLIRSNRRQWLTAQILYSLFIVLTVLTLLVVCILVLGIFQTGIASGWSDTARLEAGDMMQFEAIVPAHVRENMSPFNAMLFAAAPIFFFWFTMAMIILLCTLWGSQFVGLIICAFLLLGHFIGSYYIPYPIHFATVKNMNLEVGGMGKYWCTLGVFTLLNISLIGLMYLRIYHAELVFYTENKL